VGVVHPELPRRDRSDRCKPVVCFVSGSCCVRVVVSCGPAGEFLLVWSWFARFCEEFSFLAGCVLVVVFVLGPRGVTEASWNVVVHLLFATGLTDRVHRSDRCHRSDRQWPSG
jgi:hypothetical protein